jgi:tRNA (guanine-N7-)-methyltransferase
MTPEPPSPPPFDPAAFLLDMPESPVDWTSLFGNDHPVELEIGPGKGLFLANAATARPAHNFLGVEIARKYARRGAERASKKGLANVRVIPGDGRRFLHEFVPESSLTALHVYFPDPWWKKRHKKRRVFTTEFVTDVARALKPGRDFWFATDVEEYFEVMLAVMTEHPEFSAQPPPQPNEPTHDLDYLTNFERKYRIEGRPIHRAHYRLT